jgi:GNAT superfamily N-acetyltransferase
MKKVYTGWYGDGVLITRLKDNIVDKKIEEAKRFFSKLTSRWIWPVYSSSLPRDLGDRLLEHGFKKVEEKHPLMAVSLEELGKNVPMPDGLEIRGVVDDAALSAWSKVFLYWHGIPERLIESGLRQFQAVGLKADPPVSKFLGYYNGLPVACTQIMYGQRAARLNFVTTLPEARGKGISTAVSLASLLSARERGYKVAVLTSTDMGYPIYMKLGFKEICSWNYYLHED